MDFSKRLFLSAAFAGMMTPMIGQAADSVIKPTPDESKMIAYMKDRGVNHFLMLSKQRGQILFVVGNEITSAEAALSGKVAGDAMRKDLGVTPSGIFMLRAIGDSDYIGFKRLENTIIDYSIHPVLDIQGQQRQARLESMRPEWQRISSGCVNVAKDTIPLIRGMMSMNQTYKDDKTDREIEGSFFVVLPVGKRVESIFKFPDYSAR